MARMPSRAFGRFDPHRSPRWRWERARELHADHRRPTRADDRAVRAALAYLRAPGARRPRHCLVAAALALHHSSLREGVEARLLAGEPLAQIAARTEISESILAIYAHLFFDVPVDAVTWTIMKVVGIGQSSEEPAEGQLLAWIAMAFGSVVLEEVLAHKAGRRCDTMVAIKALFLAKEYAAFIRTGVAADPKILREGRELFGDAIVRRCAHGRDPLLANQINFLDAQAGLKPMPQLKDRRRSKSPTAKETAHGRATQEAVTKNQATSQFKNRFPGSRASSAASTHAATVEAATE